MDITQVSKFVDLMVGERLVGTDERGNEFTTPESPALKAFITARLGDDMPWHSHDAVWVHQKKGRALVAFLREAADALENATGRASLNPTGEA